MMTIEPKAVLVGLLILLGVVAVGAAAAMLIRSVL